MRIIALAITFFFTSFLSAQEETCEAVDLGVTTCPECTGSTGLPTGLIFETSAHKRCIGDGEGACPNCCFKAEVTATWTGSSDWEISKINLEGTLSGLFEEETSAPFTIVKNVQLDCQTWSATTDCLKFEVWLKDNTSQTGHEVTFTHCISLTCKKCSTSESGE